MPEFFTVDRNSSLAVGQVLEADLDLTGRPLCAIKGHYTDADLEDLARDLFDGGLSSWGKGWLFNQHINGPGVPGSHVVELVVELVRRTTFPEKPSRLSCAFGWDSLAEAREFKASYPPHTAPIFRVSCERSVRCDFNLLRVGPSILGAWLYATKYWRGEASPSPVWEELLVLPVEVLERIE